MNKLMNIPLCFCEYAMVQKEERREDKKGKRREPSLFPSCPLISSFSAFTHSNTHTQFKPNPKKILNWRKMCGNKNEALALVFLF